MKIFHPPYSPSPNHLITKGGERDIITVLYNTPCDSLRPFLIPGNTKFILINSALRTVYIHLCHFQKLQSVFESNKSPSFDVRSRLVRHLHQELAGFRPVLRVQQEVKDAEINGSAEVVDVGDEDDLFSLLAKLLQHPAALQRRVHVTMTRRVPARDSNWIKQINEKAF